VDVSYAIFFDVFVIFQEHKSLVENLFYSKIQQLQGEYLSNNFKSFLAMHEIYHGLTLTCRSTSQQNGITVKNH
jgi:hypothetical protein